MNKKYSIYLFLILAIIFFQCIESADPINTYDNGMILTYKFMAGWTGKYCSMKIYGNGDAIRYSDSESVSFKLSANDKKYFYSLLSNYSSFKKVFKPENGGFFDIDLHWLVLYHYSRADSVSIYMPLSEQEIPSDLRSLINLLRSYFNFSV